jgi:hypothetical protein
VLRTRGAFTAEMKSGIRTNNLCDQQGLGHLLCVIKGAHLLVERLVVLYVANPHCKHLVSGLGFRLQVWSLRSNCDGLGFRV